MILLASVSVHSVEKQKIMKAGRGVAKWSECSPSTLTIRVQIPLKTTVFPVNFVLDKNENKQKRLWLAH